MARPAELADRRFKDTIFNRIDRRIAAGGMAREPIALHVGDTWFDLPEELTRPLEHEPWNDRMSRYGATQGEPELRRLLTEKLRTQNGIPVTGPEEIQITFGSTGALFLAMQRLMVPGDEIITLAPRWTILKVVASAAKTQLVEVPCFDRLAEDPEASITPWLEEKLSGRSRALYFNSPNNPSGVMLCPRQIEELAAFAKKHDLWVLADEAYEDYVWGDVEYLNIGALEGMHERTLSIFSFSKSYAAAGLRLGYVAAAAGVIATLNPGMVGVGYEPNRPAQVAAIRALERRETLLPRLRAAYREGLDAALSELKLPHLNADGGYFLFLDLRDRWRGLDADAKLERMLAAGVILSPGEHFCSAYEGWARFCFTSEQPELVAEAARRTAEL
jgi:aspartate aminotransferase